MRFYNTLTRQKEDFVPIDPTGVRMYTCGPTVYNYPHIGNYRAYIFADILKRALQYFGYDVKHIMNLTDVDDKTIRDSQKEGKTLKEFTEFYSQGFFEDSRALNILPPVRYTKATEYIGEMVKITETLMEKGIAYKSEDGSIYYDIRKFDGYGKLSRIEIDKQKENASGRIKKDEYEKDNVQDFALWKSWDENDGEVFWDPSTWLGTSTNIGKGRPGWHIECSAMSMANLGEQLDIHTGGVDLIFPHHENEIAQSEGVTGKQFVKYWLHNEWLLADGKKMSKSLGNFYTLRDVQKRGIHPLAFRLWILMAHYQTRINFTWEAIEASETALKRLYGLYQALGNEIGKVSEEYKAKFKSYVEDDLDTPKAVALVWDLLKDGGIPNADKRATLLDFDKVLGLSLAELREEKIPEEVLKLVKDREKARESKDFKLSDELRERINSLGYEVKDTSGGQKVSRI